MAEQEAVNFKVVGSNPTRGAPQKHYCTVRTQLDVGSFGMIYVYENERRNYMKKTNPLILWIVLWVVGNFLIILRNKISAGDGLEIGSLVFQNIILAVVVIPVAIVGYFILRFIAKAVGYPDFLEGKKGLRNITIVWLFLYLLVFLIPLF